MRVLIVHNSYKIPGGEDSVVQDELSLLKKNGINTEYFTAANDAIDGITSRFLAGLAVVYNPAARFRLFKKIAEFNPDVVHVHNFFPLLSPSIFDACRDAHVPCVITLHNFRIICPGALLYPDEKLRERSVHAPCWWTVPKRVYRNSAAATLALAAMVEYHKRTGTWKNKVDTFIALSSWAKNKFIEAGIPADRIAVKPSAVARPPATAELQRRGALFVGRLDEQKGIKDLLEAWKEIDYPLRVIGDGPLQDLLSGNSLRSVTYLGRQNRTVVQKEMHAAKFLLLPSTGHEMFPLTIIEAFSCHLPVVCSGIPSLQELVADGITGMTFPPRDPERLRARIRWAIAHPQALDTCAGRAYAAYERLYSPEANFDHLIGIYRSASRARREVISLAPRPTM